MNANAAVRWLQRVQGDDQVSSARASKPVGTLTEERSGGGHLDLVKAKPVELCGLAGIDNPGPLAVKRRNPEI